MSIVRGSSTRLQALISLLGSLSHDNISQAAHNLFFDQQNTGGQLHALTIEWQELCQKNIAIQAACVDLQNQIDQLKLEAKELYVHSLPPPPAPSLYL